MTKMRHPSPMGTEKCCGKFRFTAAMAVCSFFFIVLLFGFRDAIPINV
jgi:hypothetical protein